ncbi:MAG TPA: GTP 3',8-cyclase MoaA [Anaeromyxobacteraceae bacterium]|nr:GTP 3',8-cyclase MoaA [Anaeromyxobacteraceae bacterium]
MTGATLQDAQGRRIRYLRLSLTDRCNYQCSYCSPQGEAGGCEPVTRADVLRLVRVFAALGVERVRLTGGEPTLRRDLLDIVRDVASVPGVREIALTTNGHLLGRLAAPLREAGVSRLNVSLDTLRPERLARLSGRAASLPHILGGLEAAGRARYASIKLNAVVVRGENDDELGGLARFAWRQGAVPRFIELMPFGRGGEPVPTAEVKRLLEAQGVCLSPDATRGWGPAHHMRGTSGEGAAREEGLVGFIGAMTEGFCADCNRVRIGADGALRACLGGRDRIDLVPMLRAGASDAELSARIREALLAKGERHAMAEARGRLLPMVGVGG